MTKHIKLNNNVQNKINEITETLRLLNIRMFNEHNNSIAIKTDLEYINLIITTDIIIQILRDIEEQIEFGKLNLLNKNLLSLEEKKYIFERLRIQKLELKYLDEIFYYCSGSITISGDTVLIMAKIPLLENDIYDLINIQTINLNGSRIDTNIKLVAKHKDRIIPQQRNCDICEETTPTEDNCIANLLNHQSPRCQVKRSAAITKIHEIKKGIILLDTLQNTQVLDSCNNSRIINIPTIIETGNCTIKILNYTFNADKRYEEEYLVPIYGKPTTFTEADNNTIEIEKITPLIFTNLEKLRTIELQLNNSKVTLITGVSILLLVIIVCSFIFYSKSRKQQSIDFQSDKNPEPPKVIELEKTSNTDQKSSEPSKPIAHTKCLPRTVDGLRGEALHREGMASLAVLQRPTPTPARDSNRVMQ